MLLAIGNMESHPEGGGGYSYGHGSAKVSLVLLSEGLGWTTSAVIRELRRLQLNGEIEYTLSDRSFHVTILRIVGAPEVNEIAMGLHRQMAMAEASEVNKVECVYRALAAEVESTRQCSGARGHPQSEGPQLSVSALAKGPRREGHDGDNSGPANKSSKPMRLDTLHETISQYFDESGPVLHSGWGQGREKLQEVDKHEQDQHEAIPPAGGASAFFPTEAPQPAGTLTPGGDPTPLPHTPLDKRCSEVLVRDAGVLLSNPSFRGCLNAEDGDGGGDSRGGMYKGVGGGYGGGFGGAYGATTIASHAWLLKDATMLARAMTRVFHGIGSVCFPASKWRSSPFWGKHRHHSFEEVKSKLQMAFGEGSKHV
ncbi:unnamed protein product [Discosporangium mesarthrocarpum]